RSGILLNERAAGPIPTDRPSARLRHRRAARSSSVTTFPAASRSFQTPGDAAMVEHREQTQRVAWPALIPFVGGLLPPLAIRLRGAKPDNSLGSGRDGVRAGSGPCPARRVGGEMRLLALDDGPDIPVATAIVVVGRHPACDARLDSIRVSRRHCCL